MDVRLLVTFLALCLTCTEACQYNCTSTVPTLSPSASSILSTGCPCDNTPPHTLTPAPPTLAILQVTWSKSCEGRVYLSVLRSDSLPLCQSSRGLVLQNWTGVCQRPGCLGDPVFLTQSFSHGHEVLENGILVKTICQTLKVRCKAAPPPPVGPDLRGQLVAYKVLSALLCVVFLLLLVARFGQPSLRVLQKRLSDRRQSRWIGPTQSQSVSYHRGKSAVQDTDESKRSSFPALERLTVNYSREPSSNRNSDYD
ncbi:T-cell surface glycoprotein CD5 isoform X1 [Osmerus mordax]|uniref:T-cell surface glycoprotein CD5 isoform X1 n=1 Tax=Osmerus mordax TaxID=8014 RepID=UPI00350FF3A5